MHKSMVLAIILLLGLSLLLAGGCGPKEDKKVETDGKQEPVKQTPEKGLPNLTKQYPNEIERFNGNEIFYKNKWVDEAVKLVDDTNTDRGKAIMYPGSMGKPKMANYMNRGPYATIIPGKYKLIFRLKSTDNTFKEDKPLWVDCEITYKDGGKKELLNGRSFLGSDFAPNEWNDKYELDIETKKEGTIEIRVSPTIAADTYLDYIVLTTR